MLMRLSTACTKARWAIGSFPGTLPCSSTASKPSTSLYGPRFCKIDGVTRRSFGSYIENYYTSNHAATGFSSPLRKTFVFMVFVFQAVFTFGYLFHTNYYFTGKALPKPDASSQLCSDSR